MDRTTIITLIPKPPVAVKLIVEGHHKPYFVLDGTIDAINSDSLIFRTSTQTSAISFQKIIEIVLMNQKEL